MTSVFCAICRHDENTDWAALPCGHVYHQSCITDWFNQNRSCPSCRREPNGGHIRRIYFEGPEREGPAALPDAAAATTGPEDPQKVQQLRGLLFNETQEKVAAQQQAHALENVVSRLRMERQDHCRELTSCRNEITQIMQLLKLNQSEIVILHQKLQCEEQQNRELNCALVAHEESSSLSIADHELRQLKLVTELESEKQSRRQDWEVIKQLSLENSQITEQKRIAEQEARNMSLRLNDVQSNATSTVERLQACQRELEENISVLTTVKDDCERELTQEKQQRQQDAERIASLNREAEQNAVKFRSLVAELQSQKLELEEKAIQAQSNHHRELTSEKQNRQVAERKNQQLMEAYIKLEVTANEKVNEQKVMILKALEQQKTLQNEKEELRRLLNDKETEIAKLKSDLSDRGEYESADLTGMAHVYSGVDSAVVEILPQGTMEDDNFADFSIFPVTGRPTINPSPFRPTFDSAASLLNANSESNQQHETTCILNPTLEEAVVRYVNDSLVALAEPAPSLKQPGNDYYSYIGNSTSKSVANMWDKPLDDTLYQNEAELKGEQPSTSQGAAEERFYQNFGLRQQMGTSHVARTNPMNEVSNLLFASSSDLHVRDRTMPSANMHPATKYNITEREKSTTNLHSADYSVTTEPAKAQKTRTMEAEEQEEQGETTSAVKGRKHSKLDKEKSKKGLCKQM